MKQNILLLLCCCALFPFGTQAQWLDFQDETAARLILTSVANSDDEEKDIETADLNNDGWPDVIVVRKEPFSISTEAAKSDLLLMNENGVLVDRTAQYAPEFISNITFARDLFIGDFDSDGWKDVVIANTFLQQPIYYKNLGNDLQGNWLGLVDESSTRFPVLTSDVPLICAVWAGDIDGDTDDDIYFVNYKQNANGGIAKDFLLINNGAGVFTEEGATRLGDLRNSAFGTAAQIHDVDNDGDNDIIKVSTLYSVAPWNNRGLIVLFNNGNGTFTNWQNLSPLSPYMFEAGDFNADGWLDFFVVDDGQDYYINVTSAVPNVSLTFTTTNVSGGQGGFGGNVHKADLDLDGDMDIISADVDVDIPPCNSGRKLAILENDNGAFIDQHNGATYDWADNSYDFAILDINGDGLLDFFSGGCAGYKVFMSDNCELITSSADFDNDGISDACDECPTNPDPNCIEPVDYPVVSTEGTAARQWNEMLLASIRRDFARPTVHARNLFHTSVAMWDAWAAYDTNACTYLLGKTVDGFECVFSGIPASVDIDSARNEAISFASYRLLSHRFAHSPDSTQLQTGYNVHMDSLGYDITYTSVDYSTGRPAALGNYIAQCLIDFGSQDGSNEQNLYENLFYTPSNTPLIVDHTGNPTMEDLNRWQPLTLEIFIDQSGNEIPGSTPDFLGPEWGAVSSFALKESARTTYNRDGFDYEVFHDPGYPPLIDTLDNLASADYKWGYVTDIILSSHLDVTDGVMWDISPASIGNRTTLPANSSEYPSFYNQVNGGTSGDGHAINPSTGSPYAPNMVPRADYARVLAEFWADGPESETPPGHWFTLMNYVSDHDSLEKRFMGTGDIIADLEWDVKSYLMLGGAMHDAAVTAWGIKGWYDSPRPISAIRAMADRGQCSEPGSPSYHPAGLPLMPGYIELIAAGDSLEGATGENIGKIKVKSWRGHGVIDNVDTDVAGVDWILAGNWLPYQRPSFVSPPFAGYLSGHSTFSRAAAEVLTLLTGDEYFPGGMGVFTAPQNEFLVFEDGPSVDVTLQWATYRDAADESGLSRIWGGIHPPADDIPGRKIGIDIGIDAFYKAVSYFGIPTWVEICDNEIDDDCNGLIDEGCITCDANNITSNMEVVEIGFGGTNPRVNATWNNPNGTTTCEVRGGRIAASSIGTGTPLFANISNTQVISQTNGSTVSFNIGLYNNPNVPFVIGQTYGYEVRCLCEDETAFTNWSGIIPEATFIVPAAPAGVQHDSGLALKSMDDASLILYPNPNDGNDLRIESLSEVQLGMGQIQIFDLSGKLVQERNENFGSKVISLNFRPKLNAGLYLIQINLEQGVIRDRFIVE